MILREVRLEDKEDILAIYQEYLNAPPIPGIDMFEGVRNFEHFDHLSFEEWYEELQFNKKKENLPEEFSSQTTFLVDVDGKIVGMLNARWEKVPILMLFGGLIGYSIRPSCRGMGYANEMLRLGLEEFRRKNISDIIISCKDFNLASKKVLEKNSGKLIREYDCPEDGYHYLIYQFL